MDLGVLVAVVAAFSLATLNVQASDPELTTDFAVPPGVNKTTIDGNFFTFTGLRNVTPKAGPFVTITLANAADLETGFAAVQGLGISYALLQFPPGTLNRPHTHPRGTELLYVIEGSLDVGLVDTTNKLFTQSIYQGDIFAFPKGLVHFQINWDPIVTVTALAAFSSSNAGTVSLPTTIFGSKEPINDDILAHSFGVNVSVIQTLKAAQ